MKNYILHQIYAKYKTNVENENCSFQKDLQINFYFFIRVISFNLRIKNVFMKLKNSFVCQNIQGTERIKETKLFTSKRSTTLK